MPAPVLQLRKEGRWAFMRNISIIVDFTSGLNLYPDLRLCNNSVQYAQSVSRMQSVLHKMSLPVNASTHTIGQTFSADAVRIQHLISSLSIGGIALSRLVHR